MKQRDALQCFEDELEYEHTSAYGTYGVPVKRLIEYSIENQTAKIVYDDPVIEEECVATVKFRSIRFTIPVKTDEILETTEDKTYWLHQLPQK